MYYPVHKYLKLTAFSKVRTTVRTDQNRSYRSSEAARKQRLIRANSTPEEYSLNVSHMQVPSNVDYQNVRLDRTNMKRSASLVAAPSESLSFQQPVSCQFCRTRKLKCDRGRPCFNCASRKHECAYESGKSIGHATRAGGTDPPQQARGNRRIHLSIRLGVNLEAAMFVHSM
jgi:hypothetical protein